MVLYSHRCILINMSAYDSNQGTQTGAVRMLNDDKEDMIEVMVCRKLHAAIR